MYSVVSQSYDKPERKKKSNISSIRRGSIPIHSQTQSGGGSSGSTNVEQQKSDRGGSKRNSCRRASVPQRIFRLIRRLYQNESDEEDEVDDFSILQVARYRPEDLAKLAKTTRFSKKEIQLIYRGFKQECPTGLVDEIAFKSIFAQFFPQGDATQYAHYVFNTFKHNTLGQISFEDFLSALSTVSRGTTQEKLHWIFGLYDVNHDGMITKTEMMDVVTAIYEMLGRSSQPQVEDSYAKQHVDKIFNQIDSNQDGAITIEELADWVAKDDTIIQSLSMMDTVLYTRSDQSPSHRSSLSTP